MRIVRHSLAVCLTVLFLAPLAGAQDHVIGTAALDKAVQQRVTSEQADRDAILSLLQRAEVRDVAAKAGLSLDKAQAAVSTLQGRDCSRRRLRRARSRTISPAARRLSSFQPRRSSSCC